MADKKLNKIDCKDIKLGMRFSAPVFFDDGENMFLGEEKAVKNYHIDAIQRWKIDHLITYGHPISDGQTADSNDSYLLEDVDELEEL